jgi:hypothetical protein
MRFHPEGSSLSNPPLASATGDVARAKTKSIANSGETRLVFLLAQQTIQQWQFLTEHEPGHGASVPRADIDRGLAQLTALVTRIRPLARSRNLATRFEAEELLQMLTKAALELEAMRSVGGAGLDTSQQSAMDIKSRLTAKVRGRRKRQPQ